MVPLRIFTSTYWELFSNTNVYIWISTGQYWYSVSNPDIKIGITEQFPTSISEIFTCDIAVQGGDIQALSVGRSATAVKVKTSQRSRPPNPCQVKVKISDPQSKSTEILLLGHWSKVEKALSHRSKRTFSQSRLWLQLQISVQGIPTGHLAVVVV